MGRCLACAGARLLRNGVKSARGRRQLQAASSCGSQVVGLACGEVAEWFKAAVLKTAVGSRSPWVRIPPSPPILSVEQAIDDGSGRTRKRQIGVQAARITCESQHQPSQRHALAHLWRIQPNRTERGRLPRLCDQLVRRSQCPGLWRSRRVRQQPKRRRRNGRSGDARPRCLSRMKRQCDDRYHHPQHASPPLAFRGCMVSDKA
jgi:hypothetical protein